MDDAYTTMYRWEWFRRRQWREGFRRRKAHSPAGFKRILAQAKSKIALDCSCGLGLKTIVMKELGIEVHGSDACPLAIGKARQLARLEGLDIPYFLSTWAELPKSTDLRFDGVFNDALCYLETDQQFQASIRGIREVLAPGGALVWMGAAKGDPPGKGVELVSEKFRSLGRYFLNWSHSAGGVHCTNIAVRELGPDYMDEHMLFLITDAAGVRLETATIRQPAWWDWARVERLFLAAGYSELRTETFEGLGAGDRAVRLNVAVP